MELWMTGTLLSHKVYPIADMSLFAFSLPSDVDGVVVFEAISHTTPRSALTKTSPDVVRFSRLPSPPRSEP